MAIALCLALQQLSSRFGKQAAPIGNTEFEAEVSIIEIGGGDSNNFSLNNSVVISVQSWLSLVQFYGAHSFLPVARGKLPLAHILRMWF